MNIEIRHAHVDEAPVVAVLIARLLAELGDQEDDTVEAHVLRGGEAFRQAELGEVDGHQHDQERQERQGDHRIGQAHEERVQGAAVVAGDKAQGGADDRRAERRGQADGEGDLAAVEQAQQQVAPQLVGAERVGGRGRGEAGQQVDPVGIEAEGGLDQGRGTGDGGEQHQHQQAREGQAVAQEAAPQELAHRLGRALGIGGLGGELQVRFRGHW